VLFNAEIENDLELDTDLTAELKEEGMIRELIRLTQQLRRDAGYKPEDIITVSLQADERIRTIIERNSDAYKERVGAKTISFVWRDKNEATKEFSFEGSVIKLGVLK